MSASTNTSVPKYSTEFVESILNGKQLHCYSLFGFFTLAILITWLFALPSFLFALPFKPFHTGGAYGPFLAALIISAALGGNELKSIFARMTNLRFGHRWCLLAIFGNLLLYLLVAGLAGAPLMQSLADKWTLIFTLYLPTLFTSFLVNPIGEETGWTGFATTRLQQRLHPWLSAIILGVIWSAWHLPGFFVRSEMGALNSVNFIFFVLSSIFIRITWTWVINNAQGSGIVGILLHVSSSAVSLALIPNLLPVPTPEQMPVSGLLLLGFMILLSVVLLLFSRARLYYKER